MRLWHQDLIPDLPRQQLLGQHRECCALRGNSWGKKHSIVDYVFEHSPLKLALYHVIVMWEMERRGYKADSNWLQPRFRGYNCSIWDSSIISLESVEYPPPLDKRIYDEHNDDYYDECILNLRAKGNEMETVSLRCELNDK